MTNETYKKVANISEEGEKLLKSGMELLKDNITASEYDILLDTMKCIIRHERLDAVCIYGNYMIK